MSGQKGYLGAGCKVQSAKLAYMLPCCPVVRCPVVLSSIGFSGSGKTTLIEQLVQRLTTTGYKVGVIKHHHEQRDRGHGTRDIGIDVKGKDTWRYRQSGAAVIALVASNRMMLFLPEGNLTAEEALEQLTRQFPVDLVLVEGFKQSSLPKFIVLPPEMTSEDARQMLSQLLSQIGDTKIILGLIGQPVPNFDLPCFAHNEIERICEFVEQWSSKRL